MHCRVLPWAGVGVPAVGARSPTYLSFSCGLSRRTKPPDHSSGAAAHGRVYHRPLSRVRCECGGFEKFILLSSTLTAAVRSFELPQEVLRRDCRTRVRSLCEVDHRARRVRILAVRKEPRTPSLQSHVGLEPRARPCRVRTANGALYQFRDVARFLR